MNLVQESAQGAVVQNSAIPDEHNQGVIQEATQAISGGLQQELANGGFQNVLKTLGGQQGLEGNPLVNNISQNFMEGITKKFGINSQTAASLASTLIPLILSKLVHKTNDANDNSFDLSSIFSSLTGGQSSGLNLNSILQSVAGKGLDRDGDGDTDLNDITSMISGAAQGQQQSGGGIMGALKGIFGG